MRVYFIAILSVLLFAFNICAEEQREFIIKIKHHHFVPSEIKVPAGKKIRLRVVNEDSTAEEFESFDLKREKIVPGNSEARIIFGPLKHGMYKFFGEFHEKTAQGIIIAE